MPVRKRSPTSHPFAGLSGTGGALVPATGWFEWQKRGNGKQPFHMRLKTGRPMAMAGIWEDQDGTACFTLLTRSAIPDLRTIHHRQPVVVGAKDFATWLQPDSLTGDLMAILQAETPKSVENREKEIPSTNENKAITEEIHQRTKAIAESLFKEK